MLYIINGKYYMLRNREYVSVNVELKNNELSIAPNRNDTIELSDNIKFKSISIEDVIKKLQIKEQEEDSKYKKKQYNM